MRGTYYLGPAAVLVALVGIQDSGQAGANKGYVSIFDGKTLKGWHVSAKSGHSGASKHKSGGNWRVVEGAIVGSQDIPGNGGIVITDKQDYHSFEVVLEMRNDFGPDSGLFLRSNDKGQAFQAMIDYHVGGNLMGVYGEGLGGFGTRNFTFIDKADPGKIKEDKSVFKLPVAPADWPKFWKHGEWNELKARIEGDPAKITTWIKGVKFMEWTDKEKRPLHVKKAPARKDARIQIPNHGSGNKRIAPRWESLPPEQMPPGM